MLFTSVSFHLWGKTFLSKGPPFRILLFTSWEVKDLSNFSFLLTLNFPNILHAVMHKHHWDVSRVELRDGAILSGASNRSCPETEIWCKLAIRSFNIQILQWKTADKHRKDWSESRVEHRKIPPLTSSPHDLTNRVRMHFGESSAVIEWETPR